MCTLIFFFTFPAWEGHFCFCPHWGVNKQRLTSYLKWIKSRKARRDWSRYLSYLVSFLFDVGFWGLAVAHAHHLRHGYRRQRFGPYVLLFQVLHHFVLLRLNLGLELLTWLSQLLLCLLQCSLVVCTDLIPQALLLFPTGGRNKISFTSLCSALISIRPHKSVAHPHSEIRRVTVTIANTHTKNIWWRKVYRETCAWN